MADNRNFWNQYADEWSRNIDSNADIQRNEFIVPMFLQFVGQLHEKKIIELGCGEGGYTRHYASEGNDVTGVDYADAMLAIAREKSAAIANARFVCDDIMSLEKIADGAYDVALAPMSLMDCTELARAYKAIARTLRPGGELYVSVLHPCFFTVSSSWEIVAGEVRSRKVAEYFAMESRLVNWTNSTAPDRRPVKSHQYPHRLESYINAALVAGLQLAKLAEPPIDQEYLLRNGPRHQAWARHAALILLLHFTKL